MTRQSLGESFSLPSSRKPETELNDSGGLYGRRTDRRQNGLNTRMLRPLCLRSVSDTAFFVVSNLRIKEVKILKTTKDFATIHFIGRESGTRLRLDRLFPTKEAAEASIRKKPQDGFLNYKIQKVTELERVSEFGKIYFRLLSLHFCVALPRFTSSKPSSKRLGLKAETLETTHSSFSKHTLKSKKNGRV